MRFLIQIQCKILFFVMIMVGLSGLAAGQSVAQAQSNRFILKQADTLTLYTLSEERALQELFQFPPGFHLFVVDEKRAETTGKWIIPRITNVVPSPDGQHIAFVAYRGTTEFALFVYTMGKSALREHTIPGIAS